MKPGVVQRRFRCSLTSPVFKNRCMSFVFAIVNVACVIAGVVASEVAYRRFKWRVSSASYCGAAIGLALLALCAHIGNVPFVLFHPLKPLSPQVVAAYFPIAASVVLLLAVASALFKRFVGARE